MPVSVSSSYTVLPNGNKYPLTKIHLIKICTGLLANIYKRSGKDQYVIELVFGIYNNKRFCIYTDLLTETQKAHIEWIIGEAVKIGGGLARCLYEIFSRTMQGFKWSTTFYKKGVATTAVLQNVNCDDPYNPLLSFYVGKVNDGWLIIKKGSGAVYNALKELTDSVWNWVQETTPVAPSSPGTTPKIQSAGGSQTVTTTQTTSSSANKNKPADKSESKTPKKNSTSFFGRHKGKIVVISSAVLATAGLYAAYRWWTSPSEPERLALDPDLDPDSDSDSDAQSIISEASSVRSHVLSPIASDDSDSDADLPLVTDSENEFSDSELDEIPDALDDHQDGESVIPDAPDDHQDDENAIPDSLDEHQDEKNVIPDAPDDYQEEKQPNLDRRLILHGSEHQRAENFGNSHFNFFVDGARNLMGELSPYARNIAGQGKQYIDAHENISSLIKLAIISVPILLVICLLHYLRAQGAEEKSDISESTVLPLNNGPQM